VVSKAESLGSIPGEDGALPRSSKDRRLQRRRETPVLIRIVVDLGRSPDHHPAVALPREQPGLDAALAEPAHHPLMIEALHRRSSRGSRKRHRRERADHALRTGGRNPDRLSQQTARLEREGAIAALQLRPAAGKKGAEIVDAGRDAEPPRRIDRSGPVEFGPEPRRLAGGIVSPADHRRMDRLLPVAPDVQHRRPLRGAQPLVRVRGVERRPQRLEIERQHPQRVRPIDHRLDAALAQRRNDPRHGKDQARGARHVVDQREPRARAHRGEDRLHDLGRVRQRERHRGRNHAGTGAGRDIVEGPPAGAVGMVRGQDLVPGGERQGAQDGVHPGGRIADEREVVGAGADELPERRAHFREAPGEGPHQEVDRLRLEFRAQPPLVLEDLERTGAERAMVEIGDVG